MRNIEYQTDLCVIGGGLSGLCCAIAAARGGIKTVLVHDRAVLGGNASEEIRMWICGAHGKDNRETGIIEEIVLENFYRNPSSNYSVWSMILYEKAICEENLTLLLNTSCFDAKMNGEKIKSVKAWQSNAETYHIIEAKYFADCSGDSVLSTLTGAEFMYGREAKSEFSETIPPDKADKKTMGMSCLFQIRETDRKCTFIPPKWAYVYETDDDLPYKDHDINNNFWWIELGGEWDCVHDTDRCRDELLKIVFGVWDHMKNKGEHGADNWELEWIGFLPGKRESRRYVGKHIITQNDVEAGGKFSDTVAFAGWTMDDHFPEGFNYRDGHPTIYHPAPSPWGIPLRSLVSKNIENLCFAGRNISVTHAALSSSRVMATCAVMGQALGTAASLAAKAGCAIGEVDINALQQKLMRDDCFIPGFERRLPDLTLNSDVNCEIVRNGRDRGEENLWVGNEGDFLEYSLKSPEKISRVRLVFDSDLNRTCHNMPCNYPLKQIERLPKTLVKDFDIETVFGDKKEIVSVRDNHQRFVTIDINKTADKVRFVPKLSGCGEFRVFDFEIE